MTSQNKIEEHIKKFFTSSKDCTFLEIGCWDGETISQTAQLEREGWNGWCVDPFPRNFANRDCTLVTRAISKDGLDREFLKVHFDKRDKGDVSYFSGFKDNIKDHLELIEKHCHYESIMIKTITIDDLYKKYKLPYHIHFLSVDTEGSEIEIFNSINFKVYTFSIIMFEHNGNQDTMLNIDKIMKLNGYKLYAHLDIDSIYINKDLIELIK